MAWVSESIITCQHHHGRHLGGLCSIISKLVAVVMLAHDHVHHSLHEGLYKVMVEALDRLDERLEGLTKTKSCKNYQITIRVGFLSLFLAQG